MSNHTETTEEAVSALRRYADTVRDSGGAITVSLDALRSYADRIEAAAERMRDAYCELCKEKDEAYDRLLLERDRAIQATPGNAAAMRAALENVERVARFCAETPRHTPGYPTDAARADVLYSRIAELGRVARAALTAPPRNCDRFQSANDAVEGYIAAHPHDDEPDASTYGSWLFAPAQEGAEG